MIIETVSLDKTVKFGDLEPGDVFTPFLFQDLEVYYMVTEKRLVYKENAVNLKTGALTQMYSEDDVILLSAKLELSPFYADLEMIEKSNEDQ